MNKDDRRTLSRVAAILDAVPGVRNPAAVAGMVSFYYDMSETRMYLRKALAAMCDGDSETMEENLQAAEAFIAQRRAKDWRTSSRAHRFTHTS